MGSEPQVLAHFVRSRQACLRYVASDGYHWVVRLYINAPRPPAQRDTSLVAGLRRAGSPVLAHSVRLSHAVVPWNARATSHCGARLCSKAPWLPGQRNAGRVTCRQRSGAQALAHFACALLSALLYCAMPGCSSGLRPCRSLTHSTWRNGCWAARGPAVGDIAFAPAPGALDSHARASARPATSPPSCATRTVHWLHGVPPNNWRSCGTTRLARGGFAHALESLLRSWLAFARRTAGGGAVWGDAPRLRYAARSTAGDYCQCWAQRLSAAMAVCVPPS